MNLRNAGPSLRKQLPVVLGILVLFLFSTGDFLHGQKRFMLNESDAGKFKMAKRLYNKGEQLFIKGKFKKAEGVFKECLEKFPHYANADYYLARVYYQRDDLAPALAHIKKAHENYKYIAELGVNTQLEYLEKLRLQKQQIEEDIRNVQQIISRGGGGSSGVNRQQSQSEKTLASLEKTRQTLNDRLRAPVPDSKQIPAPFHYVYGNVLFKLKKYSEALEQYLEAVKTDPNHGNSYNNLANLYYMARKYQKALFYLQKAQSCGVKINPRFKQALYKAMRK